MIAGRAATSRQHADAGTPGRANAARQHLVLIVDDENGVRDLDGPLARSGRLRGDDSRQRRRGAGAPGRRRRPRWRSATSACPATTACGWPTRSATSYPRPPSSWRPACRTSAPRSRRLRQGVIDYLTKPFGRDRLREAVTRGIEWHQAACDSRRWRESLEQEMAHPPIAADTTRSRRCAIDRDEALDAMLSMLTLSDRDAYAHAYRVAALAASVGARWACRTKTSRRSNAARCCTTSASSRCRRRSCASPRR